MLESIALTLPILIKGMVGIFAVIGVLVLSIMILNKLTK